MRDEPALNHESNEPQLQDMLIPACSVPVKCKEAMIGFLAEIREHADREAIVDPCRHDSPSGWSAMFGRA